MRLQCRVAGCVQWCARARRCGPALTPVANLTSHPLLVLPVLCLSLFYSVSATRASSSTARPRAKARGTTRAATDTLENGRTISVSTRAHNRAAEGWGEWGAWVTIAARRWMALRAVCVCVRAMWCSAAQRSAVQRRCVVRASRASPVALLIVLLVFFFCFFLFASISISSPRRGHLLQQRQELLHRRVGEWSARAEGEGSWSGRGDGDAKSGRQCRALKESTGAQSGRAAATAAAAVTQRQRAWRRRWRWCERSPLPFWRSHGSSCRSRAAAAVVIGGRKRVARLALPRPQAVVPPLHPPAPLASAPHRSPPPALPFALDCCSHPPTDGASSHVRAASPLHSSLPPPHTARLPPPMLLHRPFAPFLLPRSCLDGVFLHCSLFARSFCTVWSFFHCFLRLPYTQFTLFAFPYLRVSLY